jgi:methyl-accepting chemotaxis protein
MRFWTLTTLTQKLCVYIGTATGAVLLLTVGFNYEIRRQSVDQESNAVALDHIQTTAQNIDAYIDRVAMLPKSIAARQEALKGEPNANTIPFLTHLLDAVPPEEAYGVYEAFERKHYTETMAYPWVDRKSTPNLVQPKYDYHQTDWYKGAKQTGNLFISEPYFDRGGSNITMVSVAKPFFNSEGDLLGVAGVDVSLELIRLFASYLHLRSGEAQGSTADYAFLVSRQGRIIAHPDERLMPREDFRGAEASSLPDGKFVVGKPSGFARFQVGREGRRVYWATAPLSGW